ncbi:MAG: ATP-binding cassette domain-containing protein [Sinobacteraceae bacterium]|nr:ATP-binding cassette domain-containing protein [Nevskiaceae bacterium]
MRRASPLTVALEGVSLHRDERHILDRIHWRLEPGQRWLLLGGNGAGKTQLLKLIAGAVWPDPTPTARRRYLWRRQWHETPQQLHEHIAYVGPERQDRHERHGWNFTAIEVVGTGLSRSDIPQGPLRSRQRVAALGYLRTLGITRLAARKLLELSYGQRRLVLLARALATRPSLLLLDELLGGLDAQHRARVLRALARCDIPWVLSTHRIEEMPPSTTHVARLVAGRLLEQGPRSSQVPHLTSASRVGSRPAGSSRLKSLAPAGRSRSGVLVAAHGIDVYLDYRAVLRGIDFTVCAGQCWVLHGGNGSGKTTLLRALYGDHPPALGGRIERRGLVPGVPLEVFRRWCAIVAPHLQSDPPAHDSALEIVVSGLRSSIGLDGAPSAGEQRRALGALAEMGLREYAGQRLRELSYGQARRVLFARALVLRPRLLLLDEPLAGIDVDTRRVLRERIDAFVSAGGTVIMSSHHRDEWPQRTSHELHLVAGRTRYAGVVRR